MRKTRIHLSLQQLRLKSIDNWPERARRTGWREKALAIDCGVCTRTLQRFWKNMQPTVLRKWLELERFALGCQLLTTTNLSLADISRVLAYRDPSAFSNAFKARFGMCPRNWRKQHKNRGT